MGSWYATILVILVVAILLAYVLFWPAVAPSAWPVPRASSRER